VATDRDGRVTEVLSVNPGPGNPRNSEGDIIALRDGRLMLVYTRFTGGTSDDAAADLVARYSADGGLTWSGDEMLLPREGEMNSMSVSLLRLSSGALAIFYLVKNSLRDCYLSLRTSEDEARTWSERVRATPGEGYYVVNNARVVQLPSGRLAAPASWHEIPPTGGPYTPGLAMCFFSDDLGRTWRRSKTTLVPPLDSVSGLQEPGLIRLTSGTLLMLIRTDLGQQYRSFSQDEGNTWTGPEPSGLASPLSPCTLRRIPGSGEVLAIWNDHSHIPEHLKGKRTPLVTAISRDEGATWQNRKVLEDDPEGWFCYTSCTFNGGRGSARRPPTGEHALLAYCAGGPGVGTLNRLRVTRIRRDWLLD
jgi:sialidase-1